MEAAARYLAIVLATFAWVCVASAEERGVRPPREAPKLEAAQDEVKLPDNVAMLEDVVYGKGGGRDLKLYLFAPKDRKPSHPGIVFVHGGAWRKGSPALYFRQAAYMASKGYVCASIEYRLSGEATFPAAAEDAKCAVRWMRANAKKYRIDPDRIAAVGGSAGGHLAAMLGVMSEEDGLEGTGGHAGYSSKVNAVVAFYGVFDFLKLGVKNPEGAIPAFLGGLPDEVPEVYKQASPITYVDKSDAPFLLLHGTADKLVPIKQSMDMKRALEKVGVRAELYVVEEGGHGFDKEPSHYQKALARIEKFLDDIFGRKFVEARETSQPTTKRR